MSANRRCQQCNGVGRVRRFGRGIVRCECAAGRAWRIVRADARRGEQADREQSEADEADIELDVRLEA
jgi:hypothetical protein